MIKLLTIRTILFLAIIGAACSCSSDDPIVSSNTYDSELGVGFKELKFSLPYLERFSEAVGYEDVVLRFVGEQDHVGYDLPAKLVHEDGVIYLEIQSEEIHGMSHQIYYLNTLKYYPAGKSARAEEASSDSDEQTVQLGIKISLEDADYVDIISEINTLLDMISITTPDNKKEIFIFNYRALNNIYYDWCKDTTYVKNTIIYRQTDDIDLTNVAANFIDTVENLVYQTNLYPGNWAPIGGDNQYVTDGLPFNQTYDGNGFTISRMQNQEDSRQTALFYKLGDGAEIKNVSFEDTFYTNNTNSASVAVCAAKDAIISFKNVFVSGVISGGSRVGGFISENRGAYITFDNCSSMMSLSSSVMETVDDYGGFIGLSYDGIITFNDCSFLGSITNVYSCVGGFIGDVSSSDVIITGSSTVSGNITSRKYVGGFFGCLSGSVVYMNGATVGSAYCPYFTAGTDDNGDPNVGSALISSTMAFTTQMDDAYSDTRDPYVYIGGIAGTIDGSTIDLVDVTLKDGKVIAYYRGSDINSIESQFGRNIDDRVTIVGSATGSITKIEL